MGSLELRVGQCCRDGGGGCCERTSCDDGLLELASLDYPIHTLMSQLGSKWRLQKVHGQRSDMNKWQMTSREPKRFPSIIDKMKDDEQKLSIAM